MDDRFSDGFVREIKQIIDEARSKAVRSVDFCRVQMYWAIGKRISEKEQQGKERAEYGKYIIRNLAKEIEPLYGSGFGVRQLELSRQFYRTYLNANTLCSQLNWSQYKLINPTIGLLLCTEKNDTAVRLALPEDNKTILAGKYQLFLPTEEQLRAEVEKQKRLFLRQRDVDYIDN